jgi:uncharacterized protein
MALPDDLARLLTVQEHDSSVATLRHRRTHLPEMATKAEVEQRVRTALAQRLALQTQLDVIAARQQTLETVIADLDAKIRDLDARLYAGTVTSPKELQALEADIASIKAHRSTQEDAEIEVLLEREPLDASIASLNAELDRFGLEITALDAEIAVAVQRIDTEIDERTVARTQMISEIPASLSGLYEQRRTANRGIGVARLEHGTCMSCRIHLPAVDLDRIRHAGAEVVAQCPECSSILVR